MKTKEPAAGGKMVPRRQAWENIEDNRGATTGAQRLRKERRGDETFNGSADERMRTGREGVLPYVTDSDSTGKYAPVRRKVAAPRPRPNPKRPKSY